MGGVSSPQNIFKMGLEMHLLEQSSVLLMNVQQTRKI